MSGATIWISAPAAMSCRSFAVATGPPPTSSTRRPRRFRKSGNKSVINKKGPEAEELRAFGPVGFAELDHAVIVDSRAARPSAPGLMRSPQQQQQVHAQVNRPITMPSLYLLARAVVKFLVNLELCAL